MKIHVLDTDLEFDILDAEQAERYEDALEQLRLDGEALFAAQKNYTKRSQQIRAECQSVFQFFNRIFGENTDRKIFGDKTNLGLCLDAAEELIILINEQLDSYNERIHSFSSERLSRVMKK